MLKAIYINSTGRSIELGQRNPFKLLSVDGLGGVDTDIQMQKAPFQDGNTYIDTLLESRPLALVVGIFSAEKEDIFRHRGSLSNVFNPKLGEGLLRIEYKSGVKEIRCVPETSPIFPIGKNNAGLTFQKCLINLICPDPFWMSIEAETEPIAEWTGGMRFPWVLGAERQPAFALSERGFKRKIINDGDVAAPVEIRFLGGGVNPVVYNRTTGEFVKVNRTLSKTDKLVINTAFGKKSVEIVDDDGVRTNVFNWIDINSSFWQLVPGENVIEYDSESELLESSVILRYRKRYIGF